MTIATRLLSLPRGLIPSRPSFETSEKLNARDAHNPDIDGCNSPRACGRVRADGGTAHAVTWSARLYARFEDERTRPVRDLLAALPNVDARNAIDIGCGPGNSTELLAARFPGAAVRGIDSSSDMIAAARTRLPGLGFDLEDVARWADDGAANAADGLASFDVILANAVLQWVPDHARLFPALKAKLAPGGCLAVQMPDNLDEPAHRLMRDIAADGPWAGKLAASAAARSSIGAADRYYELLRSADCKVDVWRTTYYHPLAGAAAVVEWFKGSGLKPFIEPLDEHERAEFLARYRTAVARAYPAMMDGSVLLPFPRLFIVAVA
jgi:trans-aconitate 2-methyltransferase